MNRLWRGLLATSALKFLHRYCPGFDDQPLAHLGFDLRKSWSSGPNTIFFLDISFKAKGVDTSYPHRKLTLFHTLPVDATAAITLAAGGEWRFWQGVEWMVAITRPNRCSTWEERSYFSLKAATDSLPVILTSCMIVQGCSEIPLQLPGRSYFVL